MAFPTDKTNAQDNVTQVQADHVNNLEDKVGIDDDSNTDSFDYHIKKRIGAIVEDETPSGTINGSNSSFTLANTPITGSLKLYLNGQRLKAGVGKDYTLSGTTITMAQAPETDSELVAEYRYQL